MPRAHDTQSSLADIDRKLVELQRELASVFERQGQPEAPGGGVSAAPGAAAGAGKPAPASPPEGQPAPEASSAPEHPRAEAVRLVEQATHHLAQLSQKIDELQALRLALHRSLDELRSELEDEPPEPARPSAVAPEPARPSVVAPAPARPSAVAPADDVAPSPGLGASSAPPPTPLTPTPAPDEQQAFEGRIIVNAGPFFDIAALGAFERALGEIDQVRDVYVRSFEGNRALVDVRLDGPSRFVEEMRRLLPFSLGVIDVGHQFVAVNLD